jgi:RecA-family ATPase
MEIRHWKLARGRSFQELKGRFKLICDPNNEPILATVDRLTGVVRPTHSLLRLERNVKLLRPVLIIIENASDVFGGNGNDPIAVKRFVTRQLGSLCAISGATLALIQHPSVSGMNDGTGRAGTVQWRNAGRWFLNFVSANRDKNDTGDDGDRELIVDKLNYGRPGERVRLRWKNGVFAPVPVGSAFERAAAEIPIDEAFLRCLDIKSAQRINVFFHKGRGYAPAMFEGMAEAGGYKRPALAKAMERLMSDGRIKNEPYGPPSRSSVRLVRC